jgi:hypothetical protein
VLYGNHPRRVIVMVEVFVVATETAFLEPVDRRVGEEVEGLVTVACDV